MLLIIIKRQLFVFPFKLISCKGTITIIDNHSLGSQSKLYKELQEESQIKYEIKDSVTTEKGIALWSDKEDKITSLPHFLLGTSLFRVPTDKYQKGARISVKVNQLANVYIAYSPGCGWTDESLCNLGFIKSNHLHFFSKNKFCEWHFMDLGRK